jgi:hypothetical protein
MSEQPEHPTEPRPERNKEFEDPHFHDDEDLVPQDDLDRPSRRPPARRKPSRKLPNRRHYEDQ